MRSDWVLHVVDDEDEVRASTVFLLEVEGFEVRGWPSGTAFLDAVADEPPGCVLLDVRMPDVDGLEVQRRLREVAPSLPVIMLTGHGDISIAVAAVKMGAIDFLEKPFQRTALLDSIAQAQHHLEASMSKQARTSRAQTLICKLSPRERDVLSGLLKGRPNKQIAYDIGISSRTVEIHRANMMVKLGVRSLPEAIRIAFTAGVDHL